MVLLIGTYLKKHMLNAMIKWQLILLYYTYYFKLLLTIPTFLLLIIYRGKTW